MSSWYNYFWPRTYYKGLVREPTRLKRERELKFYDDTTEDAPTSLADSTGYVLVKSMNLVSGTATGDTRRNGRKIMIRSIQMRGALELKSATTSGETKSAARYRLAIVLDKQHNKQDISGSEGSFPKEIFAKNLLGVTSTDINAPVNMGNADRFRIVWDKTWTFKGHITGDGGAGNDMAPKVKTFNFTKKVNIPILFEDTGGALNKITSNNLMLVGYCESTPASNIQIAYTYRIRFDG